MNIRTSAPIYINLPYPDSRRKVHITFKYNDKNEWISLNQVIGHLKHTPIIKTLLDTNKENSLYLYTTDDKLIKTLLEIVNDQKLLLKFEPNNPDIDYSKNVEKPKPVPVAIAVHKPMEDMTNKQFALWEKDYVADSDFLNQMFDLKSRYPDRVEIGESYPYTARIYISNSTDLWSDTKNLGAWVYLMDKPNTKPEFTVYSDYNQLASHIKYIIETTLTSVSQINDHHITSNIGQGKGNIAPISCPSHCCPNILDSVTVATSLSPNQHRRFIDQLFDEYVMITESKSCGVDACNRVIYSYPNINKIIPFIPCGCNNAMCAFCGQPASHWPNPCTIEYVSRDTLREWISISTILKTTTLCSRCHVAVERTTGCNHMTCKMCGHQFCYACGGDYFNHLTCNVEGKSYNAAKYAIQSLNLKITENNLLKIGQFQKVPTFLEFKHKFQEYLDKHSANDEEINLVQPIIKLFNELMAMPIKQRKLEKCREVGDLIGSFWQITKGKSIHRTSRTSIKHSNETDVLIKTLMCDILLNGYSQVVTQLFVNSSIELFKMEIIRNLNKKLVNKIVFTNDNSPDSQKTLRKIRLFNKEGFEVFSVMDIPQGDQLYVTLEGEMFISQPKDEQNPNLVDRKKQLLEQLIHLQLESNKDSAIEELQDLRTNPLYRETCFSDQERTDEQAIIEALQDFSDDDDDNAYYNEDCEEIGIYDKYQDYVDNY
ncbi:RING zinc finger-containing protein [Heterostelium album PN500]|uniref:RBR-type E3 ubiquitin transferase n=1 Tax=Heterostelium pallidum (strain ATCC 26659 / Pp 5 / PN500) TaxID=670386 RepID=D3BQC0_HETP5|nr:RING zinc finger-containing protein [Heterostelium album PN500]EFA76340.1 RING zinc finger-containing protein [Heterostelium album PN500]|eukprot:XP_020428472.1 RING zinc finger-containing protein [Heterostelium album PN500]